MEPYQRVKGGARQSQSRRTTVPFVDISPIRKPPTGKSRRCKGSRNTKIVPHPPQPNAPSRDSTCSHELVTKILSPKGLMQGDAECRLEHNDVGDDDQHVGEQPNVGNEIIAPNALGFWPRTTSDIQAVPVDAGGVYFRTIYNVPSGMRHKMGPVPGPVPSCDAMPTFGDKPPSLSDNDRQMIKNNFIGKQKRDRISKRQADEARARTEAMAGRFLVANSTRAPPQHPVPTEVFGAVCNTGGRPLPYDVGDSFVQGYYPHSPNIKPAVPIPCPGGYRNLHPAYFAPPPGFNKPVSSHVMDSGVSLYSDMHGTRVPVRYTSEYCCPPPVAQLTKRPPPQLNAYAPYLNNYDHYCKYDNRQQPDAYNKKIHYNAAQAKLWTDCTIPQHIYETPKSRDGKSKPKHKLSSSWEPREASFTSCSQTDKRDLHAQAKVWEWKLFLDDVAPAMPQNSMRSSGQK
jgi:hypothetical protein